MAYKLTILPKPTYLHIIVTGKNTPENVARYLEEIQNVCVARNCRRVLIEERLDGSRLGTMDVFRIVKEQSESALGRFEAVAFVGVNAEGDNAQFAENVAVNRFIPARVFATVREAEQWLESLERNQARATAEHD